MWRLSLSEQEIKEIQALVNEIASEFESVESDDFLAKACIYAHELPRRVRVFLNDFRLKEPPSGICIISGYTIDDRIGKTPTHWTCKSDALSCLDVQILLILYGSLLGDVFGWATQQDGHIVHDVFPIKGNEQAQLGTGSEQPLWWHTEDAFHPYRADYIGFLCLRNPDQVATTVATSHIDRLDEDQIKILFEPRFTIRPDESHLEKHESDLRKSERASQENKTLASAYEKINKMNTERENISVLFGNSQSPYMRLDPYFMDPLNDDEAQRALNAFIQVIDENLEELVLQPGDYCFIDNYKVVHGRRPFRARYDGNDRWIKRISMTRDLRKSRSARPTSDSRIIF